MKTVTLPDGETVSALGIGTWRMGEAAHARSEEVAAIRHAIDRGITLIDTAEMYGEGGAEEVVGEAITGCRDELFIVSKVYPYNASHDGVVSACERSLDRLGTDRIDLYLLHWPGSIPLEATVSGFEDLKASGKIRHWGVSNFDTDLMQELKLLQDGPFCASNQVLYHLGVRGIEWDLLPWCRQQSIPVMAYSPLGQGDILDAPALAQIGDRYGVSPASVAIAWTLRDGHVISIPKSSQPAHLDQNLAALDIELDADDLATLDDAFPAPTGPVSLSML